ncbi:MAG TPA: hypothetical protein VHB68_16335 [Steroidobacteraceae bacterium]|nr:hypothetical protein [Steroidobacteraceae bacterium]
MTVKLLIIDPQNDFCDIPGAALPVPGASADLARLAGFIRAAGPRLTDLGVTLDSHPHVAIERVSFWQDDTGGPIAPFTVVTEAGVRAREFSPRDPARLPEVLEYLHALEERGRYKLMVWPVHCVIGTWGHNLYAPLAAQMAAWEERTQKPILTVLKGLNPMTEQYSAVRAEVPRADDERTMTHRGLVGWVRPGNGWVLTAGEASSHCVRATWLDLMEYLSPEESTRVVFLTDCMSPVAGCEAAANDFLKQVSARGARTVTSAEALRLIA